MPDGPIARVTGGNPSVKKSAAGRYSGLSGCDGVESGFRSSDDELPFTGPDPGGIVRIKAVSMEKVVPETAADYDLEEQDSIEFRCTAAGREIAAYLCRTWTGEPLSPISERFGLSHPDSSSNLIRRAKK